MSDATWADFAARGAAWMVELGQRLEEDVLRRHQLEATQQLQQQFMEEFHARIDQQLQQLDERVGQMEGSLMKVLGNVMPKVGELLGRHQSPLHPAAKSIAPQSPTKDSMPTMDSIPDNPLVTNRLVLEPQSLSAPSDAEGILPPVSFSSASRTVNHEQMPLQTKDVANSQEASNIPLTPTPIVKPPQGDLSAKLDTSTEVSEISTECTTSAIPPSTTSFPEPNLTMVSTPTSGCRPECESLTPSIDCKIMSIYPSHSPFTSSSQSDPVSSLKLMPSSLLASSSIHSSPFHEAAALGNVATLKKILAAGGLVDARDNHGNTALHFAANYGLLKAVDFLIAKGASVNSCGDMKRTPLHWAAAGGHLPVVERLVKVRANLEQEDAEGATALSLAAGGGHQKVVDFLLNQNAAVDKIDKHGRSLMHYAVKGDNVAVACFLMNKRTRINIKDEHGNTPLMWAVRLPSYDMVNYLLLRGAYPRDRNKDGETPLTVAAKEGQADALVEMMERMVMDDEDIKSVLYVAGSAEVVRALVKVGRKCVMGTAGEEALRRAVRDCRLEVVEALLEVCMHPSACDSNGWSALHWAAEKGHSMCVDALLSAGADPNMQTKPYVDASGKQAGGYTALHLATIRRHVLCIRKLLLGGANRDVKDVNGNKALDFAEEEKSLQCISLLKCSLTE